jgi:hypothetical protein
MNTSIEVNMTTGDCALGTDRKEILDLASISESQRAKLQVQFHMFVLLIELIEGKESLRFGR